MTNINPEEPEEETVDDASETDQGVEVEVGVAEVYATTSQEQPSTDDTSNNCRLSSLLSGTLSTTTQSLRQSDHTTIRQLALSIHKELNTKFMPLFTHPQQRQRWGDEQLHPHQNWGDVFFDLFYVATAYNLGHLLTEDPTPRGLLYVIGCFLPIMGLWSSKLYYDCRYFVGNDLVHRFMEVAKLVALATAVLSIRPVSILSHPQDYNDMFLFSLALVFAFSVMLARYVEIMICQKLGKSGLYPEASCAARRDLIWCGAQVLFYVAAAIYSGLQYYHYGSASRLGLDGAAQDDAVPRELVSNATSAVDTVHNGTNATVAANTFVEASSDDVPIILLITGSLLSLFLMASFILIVLPFRARTVPIHSLTVPMHIEYSIHRFGEWIMLMLGESILSLLIVDVVDSRDYYAVFFAGVIAIIFLEYLHFRSQPHDPDEHALRRSRGSGILFNYIFQVYSISLVVLGTAYKMFLYEVVHESIASGGGSYRHLGDSLWSRWLAGSETSSTLPADVRQQNVAHLFSGSLAVVWFCLDVTILAHKGLAANIHRGVACPLSWRVLGAFFIIVRIGLIVFIATISQYETRPTYLAVIGLGGVVLQLVCRGVGSRAFPSGGCRADELDAEPFQLENTEELIVAPE